MLQEMDQMEASGVIYDDVGGLINFNNLNSAF